MKLTFRCYTCNIFRAIKVLQYVQTLSKGNILRLQKTVKEFEFKANQVISDELYNKLAPTGSRPGILYGLPQVHKPSIPLRPIVSSINSHSYPLAKYLVSLLRPISINQYTIHDRFSFVKKLFRQKFDNEIVMVSFDVTSLFAKIPLNETMEIIARQLSCNSEFFHGFSRVDFVKHLNTAVKIVISYLTENFMTKLMVLPWAPR